MIFFKNVSLIVILTTMLSSCAEKENNKLIGQIIGSVAGAYLGSKVGSGIGKSLTTAVGGTIGYLLGGKIVELLDDEEKLELNEKINSSLNNNADNVPEKWVSKKNKNTNAEILPLNTYELDNETCRDFEKVVKKNGKIYEEKSTACRDENGNWRTI